MLAELEVPAGQISFSEFCFAIYSGVLNAAADISTNTFSREMQRILISE